MSPRRRLPRSTLVACALQLAACSSARDGFDSGLGAGSGASGDGGAEGGDSDSSDSAGSSGSGGSWGTSGGSSSTGGEAGDEGGNRFDVGGGESGGTSDSGAPPDPPDDPVDPTGDDGTCDSTAPVSLHLSPDDSNSMSSAVQARAAVLAGWNLLGAVSIRTWEFFNYYRFAYPPPVDQALALDAALRPIEGTDDEFVLQVGVASRALEEGQRPAVNVTFVLDSSGSMLGPPLEMLKATCRTIAGKLRAGDHVSLVTWNTDNAVILAGHVVDGPHDPDVLAAIDAVEAAGATDLNGGLTEGYRLAEEVFDPDAINRVILVSDGGANAGVTDMDVIASHAGAADEDGIYLVGVGVGSADTYHDDLMNQVTDAGKGASVFVPTAEEAERIFDREFLSTLAIAARDVRVRLDLPPGFKLLSFSGEGASPDPTEIEPQHVGPNDAVVFHQRLRACAPEVVTDDSPVTITLRWKDAMSFEERELAVPFTFAELKNRPADLLDKGIAVMAYVDALQAQQAFGSDKATTLDVAMTALAAAEAVLPTDPDLAEIRGVLEALVP